MFFEEEYRKVIEQLKKNEDYVVMRTICEDIIGLLKENGVKVDGTIVKNVTRTKTLAIVDDFEVRFDGLDFTEHDKKYIDEIVDLQKQISELESELAVKENLLKIKNGLCNEKSVIEILKNTPFIEDVIEEEPLPFSDEEYEEDRIDELEKRIAKIEKTLDEQREAEIKRLRAETDLMKSQMKQTEFLARTINI